MRTKYCGSGLPGTVPTERTLTRSVAAEPVGVKVAGTETQIPSSGAAEAGSWASTEPTNRATRALSLWDIGEPPIVRLAVYA
jgi:hypothetical protein